MREEEEEAEAEDGDEHGDGDEDLSGLLVMAKSVFRLRSAPCNPYSDEQGHKAF
jgi:hypothetical protein